MPQGRRSTLEPAGHQVNDVDQFLPFDGWIKAKRNPGALELIRANRNAFVLLYVIAYRARWHDGFNQHQLEVGEAWLGDFREIGLTEQEYRTAKRHLEKWKFATFKPTPKGTIAKLIDSSLFDPFGAMSNGLNNTPATDFQRPDNGQATTNEERKTERKKEEARSLEEPRALKPALKLAELMEQCRRVLGDKEHGLHHRRWLKRAEENPGKLRRVLADTASKASEGGLNNPAAWAEKMWKEFA